MSDNNMNSSLKKNNISQMIPLIAGGVLLIFSIFMIFEAFRFDGVNGDFSFVAIGGKFAYNNIKIFGISFYWIMIISGLIATLVYSLIRRKTYGVNLFIAVFLPIFFFVQSLYGAKVLFGIERVIESHTFSSFNMSGQSLFGSLYFSLITIPVLALILKKKIFDLFDFISPYWFILLAFTRIGCFTSGCCGAEKMLIGDTVLYLPVQLFDSICSLVLLYLCLRAEVKISEKSLKYYIRPYPILLIGYCICRFILEFIRKNVPLFYKLSVSQYHCILFIIIGIIFINIDKKQKGVN